MGNQLKILNAIGENDKRQVEEKKPIEVVLQLNKEIMDLFGSYITEDGKTVDYQEM